MIEYRNLTDSDISKAHAFYEEIGHPETERYLKRAATELRDALILALNEDDLIVGVCGASSYYPPYGELVNLIVHPSFRKQGIGLGLTEHCINSLKEMKCPIVFLQTDKENWAAQRMYRESGFVPVAFGQMIRMMRLSEIDSVCEFTNDHPWHEVEVPSRYIVSEGRSLWPIKWYDPVKQEFIALWIEGESCQAQSPLCPIIAKFHANYDDIELIAAFTGERESLTPGSEVDLQLHLFNPRSSHFNVTVELLESSWLKAAGGGSVRIGPDGHETMKITVTAPKTIDKNAAFFSSHEAVPITYSITAGKRKFILSTAPRIKGK